MRRKTSAEDVLEPLAVYDDDGAAIEPEPAAEPASSTSARDLVRECVDAVRAVVDERSEVRTLPPWTAVDARPEPRTRPASFYTSFNRMIALSPAQLPGLPGWWRRFAHDGRVRVSPRLTLERPRPARGGTWRAPGRLRSPFLVRSIPVELLLWPYLGSWTRLSLEPQRAVHAGKRYFKRGHRSLDRLTERLVTELARTAS